MMPSRGLENTWQAFVLGWRGMEGWWIKITMITDSSLVPRCPARHSLYTVSFHSQERYFITLYIGSKQADLASLPKSPSRGWQRQIRVLSTRSLCLQNLCGILSPQQSFILKHFKPTKGNETKYKCSFTLHLESPAG